MGFKCGAEFKAGRALEMEKCTAIVLAAGQGKRMNTKVHKQFLLLQGKPVLYYSLKCFEETPWIEDIILVAGKEECQYCREEIADKYGFRKIRKIVPGGKERYDSVYQGLLACENTEYVFIHDGARPLLTRGILEESFREVKKWNACVVGVPSKDTVKIADENQCVAETPSRDRVWIIQTPQVFRYSLIKEAHDSIRGKELFQITDDAMIVEQETGCKVRLVQGDYQNIKITTPEDLVLAEAF